MGSKDQYEAEREAKRKQRAARRVELVKEDAEIFVKTLENFVDAIIAATFGTMREHDKLVKARQELISLLCRSASKPSV